MLSDDLKALAAQEIAKVGLRQLAREAEIDPTSLSRIMSGERSMTCAQLDALADRLGVRITKGRKPAAR